MRTANAGIWDPWLAGGPFVGDDAAPHAVVTVEAHWELNIAREFHDRYRMEYMRWFQRADNSQDETVIPNVKHIQISRDIGQPAGTCTITIANQWMDTNGAIGEYGSAATPTGGSPDDLGNPGYFTFDRGTREEAFARWGHATNAWNGILVPNALIRTYQGYGGRDKTPTEAISDGNLVRTGVWLVDDVIINAGGDLELRCRDTAKLLIDQSFYPPLVPEERYGKQYCRWVLSQKKQPWGSRNPTDRGETGGPVRLTYADSSENRWYPQSNRNPSIHGHYPSQALDGDTRTYWLSVGNSAPERPFSANWIEFDVHNQNLNEIYVHPWAGNYDMYVSIMEDGDWLGSRRIPYDHEPLIGNQPYVVDTNADIPYVHRTGTTWETGKWYKLPRTFRAQRLRITFRNLQRSQHGPWYYRGGIREIRARTGTTADDPPSYPSTYDMASDPREDRAGYWVVDDVGNVYAFGDARRYRRNDDSLNIPLVSRVRAIEAHPGGLGYWTMQTNGRIIAYGAAAHHGDLWTKGLRNIGDAWDFSPTSTGNGYWIIQRDGTVHAFGDAVWAGHAATRAGCRDHFKSTQYWGMGIAGHGTDGYWIVDGRGEVTAQGSAEHYGDTGGDDVLVGLLQYSYFLRIVPSKNGEGYVILNPAAWPIGFGDLEDLEDVLPNPRMPDADETLWEKYRSLTYGIALSDDDQGFYMLQADGRIQFWGEAEFFGQPGGINITRKHGNYRDYADIVRDLCLWSGFLLYDEETMDDAGFDSRKHVFGNIENTGIYSKECLKADFFDKKPIIDIINQLRDIVGYIFYVDEDGAVHWESPNWWRSGNFDEEGARTSFIPEINESLQLTNYTAAVSGQGLRSEMIISSADPTVQMDDTITTRFVPPTADLLRGIVRPFAWSNGVFQDEDEQRVMAELVALHIFFQMRQGQVTCIANPAIQINDQVKIAERTTGDVYIHYVRSVSTDQDMETGAYTMTLNTNWLGTSSNDWVITKDRAYEPTIVDPKYPISDALVYMLQQSESRSARDFAIPDVYPVPFPGGPDTDDGSGPDHVPVFEVEVTTSSLPTLTRHSAMSPVQLTAFGGTAPYTWSWDTDPQGGTLPAGLSLSSDGVLSGTPTASALQHYLRFTATDAVGSEGYRDLTLRVDAPVEGNVEINGPASIPILVKDEAMDPITFTSTGGVGTKTFSCTTTLPAGLTFNSSTGVLSATPTATQNADETFRVTDSNGDTDDLTLRLRVINSGELVIEGPSSFPTLYKDQAMDPITFTAVGGTGSKTFSCTSGLPAGLSFNSSTGVLSGTPTALQNATETFRVTDAAAVTDDVSYTVRVANAPEPGEWPPQDLSKAWGLTLNGPDWESRATELYNAMSTAGKDGWRVSRIEVHLNGLMSSEDDEYADLNFGAALNKADWCRARGIRPVFLLSYSTNWAVPNNPRWRYTANISASGVVTGGDALAINNINLENLHVSGTGIPDNTVIKQVGTGASAYWQLAAPGGANRAPIGGAKTGITMQVGPAGGNATEEDRHMGPRSDKYQRLAFAAAALARRFITYDPIIEVWNEANNQFFRPKQDVEVYVTYLRAVYRAVKEAEPTVPVTFSGLAGEAGSTNPNARSLGAPTYYREAFEFMRDDTTWPSWTELTTANYTSLSRPENNLKALKDAGTISPRFWFDIGGLHSYGWYRGSPQPLPNWRSYKGPRSVAAEFVHLLNLCYTFDNTPGKTGLNRLLWQSTETGAAGHPYADTNTGASAARTGHTVLQTASPEEEYVHDTISRQMVQGFRPWPTGGSIPARLFDGDPNERWAFAVKQRLSEIPETYGGANIFYNQGMFTATGRTAPGGGPNGWPAIPPGTLKRAPASERPRPTLYPSNEVDGITIGNGADGFDAFNTDWAS